MSASVSVTDAEFFHVAGAAMDAHARGDVKRATRLDRLARKMNAALASSRARQMAPVTGMRGKALTWKDVPSVLRPPVR